MAKDKCVWKANEPNYFHPTCNENKKHKHVSNAEFQMMATKLCKFCGKPIEVKK